MQLLGSLPDYAAYAYNSTLITSSAFSFLVLDIETHIQVLQFQVKDVNRKKNKLCSSRFTSRIELDSIKLIHKRNCFAD